MSLEADIESSLERVAELMPLTEREQELARMLYVGTDGFHELIRRRPGEFSTAAIRAYNHIDDDPLDEGPVGDA